MTWQIIYCAADWEILTLKKKKSKYIEETYPGDLIFFLYFYSFPICSGHQSAALQVCLAGAWGSLGAGAPAAARLEERRGGQLPSAVVLAQKIFSEKKKIT